MTRIEPKAPAEVGGADSAEGSETSATVPRPWHPLRRFLFRLSIPYALLYLVATPYFHLPVIGNTLATWVAPFWDHFLIFWSRTLFDIAPEGTNLKFRGVGDVKSHLYLIFGMAMTSLVVAVLWSVVDRRRLSYDRAARWAAPVVSFLVGSVVIYYGTLKIYDVQFGYPLLDRLLMSYGESRGLDLVWIFMGTSTPYTWIAGFAEIAGGFLLLFRRTRTLGALLLIGVLSHVMMLNFCFALPVKFFSLQLLIMSALLLLPDAERLVRFAIGRPIPAVEHAPLVSNPRLGKGLAVLPVLLGVALVYLHLDAARETEKQYWVEEQPIFGIFDVESFTVNGVDRPPLLTDEQRWRLILFDRVDWVMLRRMDGTVEDYGREIDLGAGTMALIARDGRRLEWTLEQPTDDTLILEGPLNFPEEAQEDRLEEAQGEAQEGQENTVAPADEEILRVVAKRRDLDSFSLTTRRFRWIIESPFDR
ncbi:MAG: hypothetical protein AAGD06_19805 [Acidobacteriota bacterium]